MELKYPHTLLLVDDEASILKSLQRLFRKQQYRIVTAENGQEALDKMDNVSESISLIISDQRMPGMTGAQFLERAVEKAPDALRFILTGFADMDAIIDAVNKGKIHRYITKPWNDNELLDQVRDALSQVELRLENKRLNELTERQNLELAELNKDLEKKVGERTWALQYQNKQLQKANANLEKGFSDSIRLLMSLVESSNPKLGAYLKTVSVMAGELADAVGLDDKEKEKIEIAGLLHDIGLIGIHDAILEKDQKIMSPEELSTYREHPVIAAMSISSVERLKEISDIVLSHHENVDGTGFPKRLTQNQIPLGARIIAVAADYNTIVHLWPENVQRMLAFAKRYLDTDTIAAANIDDPTLRQDIAEKIIRKGVGIRYDSEIVSYFIKSTAQQKPFQDDLQLPYQALAEGMLLRQDLRLNDGRLLLNRGTVLTHKTVQSIQNMGDRGMINKPIEVAKPNPEAMKGESA